MILQGDIGRLELDFLTRKEYGTNNFWEENWLYTLVKATFPGFIVRFHCNVRTDDLQRWHDDLAKFIDNELSSITLTSLEECISLIFIKNGIEDTKVAGVITDTELTGCSVKFTLHCDMSIIVNFRVELHNILMQFPIIGTP